MRGRNVDPEDAFGEVMVEVNTLSRTLYDQRLEALEAGALLQKIIADVDIAVFAFDAALRLRIVNRAGESVARAERARDLQGRSAAELGLAGDARRGVGPHRRARVSGRRRTVGDSPPQLPRRRQAARAARDLGALARAARGRAPGVAAHRARDRPRAEQLARADQVDGGHRAQARRPRAAAGGLARRRARRARRSSTTARSRSSASWAPTRGSRACRRRRVATPSSRRSCAASRRCTRRASR